MTIGGVYVIVMVAWAMLLAIWTEAVRQRSDRAEWFIQQEVRRRMARRRPRRVARSHVRVQRKPYDWNDERHVADEIEQWLRSRGR